jgi:hypothetical protein
MIFWRATTSCGATLGRMEFHTKLSIEGLPEEA